ncbi:MAG TPA: hypothetical protein VFU56_01995 [Gaiellaceae bacterium]|nr:hypothetical protein [Gaiellaceae bacterium]
MRRVAIVAMVVALATVGTARAGTGMFVGATEDNVRSLDPVVTKAKMDLAAMAGLDTVRTSVTWSPGQTRVAGDDEIVLRNVVAAAQLDGVRVIVSIYPQRARAVPLTSGARGQFASFAASIAREFPALRDFVIGNEPNLNLFWMPQYGVGGVDLAARSYELLLARTYDALKSVSDDVNVIGGALASHGEDKPDSLRPTHSPTAFIKDLGAAYRATERERPIMDMFAIHPYLIPSRLPPTFQHPRTTTIGVADYAKLVRLLTGAFRGTAQRGETLPIVYDEFGYQSEIPKALRFAYRNLGAKVARDAIPEARQAAYYSQAFALAACQPTVAGMLIFHVVDERDARAWQSGVYYANGRPKTSLAAVRRAALAAQAGTLAGCDKEKVTSNVGDVAFQAPAPDFQTTFSCLLPCTYEMRVLDVASGDVVARETGNAVGPATVKLPTSSVPPGEYQYALRVFKCGKPGTAETRFSTSFALGDATPAEARILPTLQPVLAATAQ